DAPRFSCPWTLAELRAAQGAPVPQRVLTGMYAGAWARAEHCGLAVVDGRLEPHTRYEPSDALWATTAREMARIVGVLGFGVPVTPLDASARGGGYTRLHARNSSRSDGAVGVRQPATRARRGLGRLRPSRRRRRATPHGAVLLGCGLLTQSFGRAQACGVPYYDERCGDASEAGRGWGLDRMRRRVRVGRARPGPLPRGSSPSTVRSPAWRRTSARAS